MSKKGKFSVQNCQSDPMNSPKAFGELIISFLPQFEFNIFCGVCYVKIYPNDFVVLQELNLTVEAMIHTQAPSLYSKVYHLPVTTKAK